MADWQESPVWRVPVDHRTGQWTRPVMPPPLRLYNPSRILRFDGNCPGLKYSFWNPFRPGNVLREAYEHVLKRPLGNRENADVGSGEHALSARRRCHADIDSLGRHADAWNRLMFGDSPEFGRAFRDHLEEEPLFDMMGFGRSLFNTLWSELNPGRWSGTSPWYQDGWGFGRDSRPSPDMQNYRVAMKQRDCGARSVGSYRTSEAANRGDSLYIDFQPLWNAESGVIQQDDGRSYKLAFRLPSVNEEDIKVSIQGGVLTVSARSDRVERGDNDATARHSQRFHHSVTLPLDAMERHAKANLANGTLTVKIPRRCEQTW
ncbi:hsp20/alpha crystallin family protein [Babesia caballi]|uniref:Hsp20/alpha crystallin family protein n=1 Tax=Babesia caballi TaxID=5871 RepID=A0AAV4LZ20_BABCB|nr:hsp20/alpha crystallin family protein [Babesia caballi]